MIDLIYSDSVQRLLSSIKWKGKPIPVVEAGPERAFSQAKEWVKKNCGIEKSQLSGDIPIPFPFCAYDIHDWNEDPQLANMSQMTFGKDRSKGYGYKVQKPLAVIIPCSVDFYFLDKAQKNNIKYQLINLMFPKRLAVVTIDFAEERWYLPPNENFEFMKSCGQFPLRISFEGMNDNSSLEDSGMGDRTLRFTASLQLHGIIPFQPYAVPLAEEIEVKMIVEDE